MQKTKQSHEIQRVADLKSGKIAPANFYYDDKESVTSPIESGDFSSCSDFEYDE